MISETEDLNFLVEVLATADTATLEQFREALRVVNEKISSLKNELILSLESSFGKFDSDIHRVSSWFVEVFGVDEETKKLDEKLQNESFAQSVSSEELIFVHSELSTCDSNIKLLKGLVEVVQGLESAEPSDIFTAAKRLRKAKDSLKSLFCEFHECGLKRVDWAKGLNTMITSRMDETYQLAIQEWDTKFKFDRNTLVIDPDAGKGDIPSLVEAFMNLRRYTRQCERFSLQVWQELLSKACTPNYTVKVTFPNQKSSKKPMITAERDVPVRDIDLEGSFDGGSSSGVASIATFGTHNTVLVHVKKLDTPITQISNVFKNICRLIAQLEKVFTNKFEMMRDMAEVLGPKMVSQLSTKCLKSLILQESNGSKQRAKDNILQLHQFREELKDMNFVMPEEHESVFDEFEANFECLFMRQVREDTLARIRTLIKSDMHHTIEALPSDDSVFVDSNEEEFPTKKCPYLQESYTISRSIAEMVETLKSFAETYPQDIQLISQAFNIFICIVNIPKHESEAKDFIPITPVLIHNNCEFLTQHAESTFSMCEDKIPPLRTKAKQAFACMVKGVRAHLNSMIADGMTGLDCDEESEPAKRKRELQFLNIAAEFERLDGIFKGILPQTVWRETLAALVDHILNEICLKVIACEDIAANMANDLADVFTKFAVEVSSLFKKEGLSPREVEGVAIKLVPKWQRFRLLTFVLTASMKEIEHKWVNGCGPLSMVFTAEEVRKLVRGLFQNTEHRAAFLATIR